MSYIQLVLYMPAASNFSEWGGGSFVKVLNIWKPWIVGKVVTLKMQHIQTKVSNFDFHFCKVVLTSILEIS